MLNPKFIEFLKKDFPDDWQTIVNNMEKLATPEFVEFAKVFCEAFGVEPVFINKQSKEEVKSDPVNHPSHYVKQAATIEPIEVLRFAPFDLGNALKYMIRAGHKENELQDLKKAEWYLKCAIKTMRMDSIPYVNFFNRYAFILQNFNGIPSDLAENCDYGCIEELLVFVQERIAKERNK